MYPITAKEYFEFNKNYFTQNKYLRYGQVFVNIFVSKKYKKKMKN